MFNVLYYMSFIMFKKRPSQTNLFFIVRIQLFYCAKYFNYESKNVSEPVVVDVKY